MITLNFMIKFDWDESKASSNFLKHGIRFEDAVRVFDDPYAITESDEANYGEIRWRTIGLVEGTLLMLFVVHTSEMTAEDESVRLISARRTTRKEEERYGKNRQSHS